MSFNKLIIVGNLGRDPELKYTPQGQEVCEFSVATSEKRKDSEGESKEETTWFRVTFWGRQAQIASQYLAKGRQVYVEGRLRAREWTDKEGRQRTSLEIFGTDLRLLGNRSDEQKDSNSVSTSTKSNFNAKSYSAAKAAPAKVEEFDDTVTEDDIPF